MVEVAATIGDGLFAMIHISHLPLEQNYYRANNDVVDLKSC